MKAYDAVIVIALAAEAADSVAGPDIRDQLQAVASPGGTVVIASQDSITEAGLRIAAADDGDDVNYEGAASSVDWDAAGDITSTGTLPFGNTRTVCLLTQETIPFTLN